MAERRAAHERLSTGALARWTRACATHPWRVIASWVGIFAVLIALVGTIGGELRDEFSIPGSETQKATDLIEAEFGSEQGGVLNLVFAAPEGERLDTPERRAAIEEAVTRLEAPEFKPSEGKAGVVSVGDPFDEATFAENGRIAYAEAQFDKVIYDKDREAVVAVQEAVRDTVEPAGVTVEYNGDAEFPPIEQGTSELLGLLAAIVILLVVFRTLVAMFIPIVLAIVALAAAFLLLFIFAGFTDINTITPILVSMIGLGVGIDYSLFIVTRFRQALHDGLSPQDAAAEAGATAGRAVLFAGATVAIAVSGLAVIGLDFVTKLGMGSALGVLTTVLIANSLLLAVLSLLGHKVDRLKVPFLREGDDSEQARDRTLVARWGRFVTANAKVVFSVVMLLVIVLASTSAFVRLGAADQGTQPTEQTARRAYDLLAEGFGPGFNGPVPIVVDVNDDPAAPQKVYDGVRALDGVAFVGEPQLNEEGTVGIVFVTPTSSPQDEETDDLVDALRTEVVPAATAGGNAAAYVSGQTAAFKDIGDQILDRMPLFLLYIIGVTFLVLAMAFRSVVISAKAAVTTILSAFVGFGVLGLIVQQGHLLGLTGLDTTGPIETFVPPIGFAILFGLSMDYEVFLMSRIREEHVHGLRTRAAVEHGMAAIGRVVVAAALIMGTVFAAFILGSDRVSKEFGILLAVAILTDALLVRLTLVPSLLTLLGERSWYMPRWLDRVLPRLTIESPHDDDPRATAPPERPLETAGHV
ncbi:MAG: Integral membrane protein [uncultured Thermoleophilia bacterium]|uniref:Integral membrane protein n=1 Tax=uncultured Thermoleophilia bacterium TaxID=1497501 RepID=A0A6J4UE52_9ACTN|nr:MAG: Integral membrane protein [uncultured Thermoleophilia bacterium]